MDPVDPPPPTDSGPTEAPPVRPAAPPPGGEPAPQALALRTAPERREVALILGLVLLLNILPGGMLQLIHLRWGLLVSQVLFVAAPVLLAIRWFYLDRRAILPLRSPGKTAVAGSILGIIGLNHILNCGQAWQERHFPMPQQWRDLFVSLTSFDGPADFVLLLLLVGIVPGICEEILFRGFVYSGLRRTFESDGKAIIVGALVFAGFHLNPWSFSSLLVIGLYLGLLVQRTRSLLPAMIAHALNNILSLGLASLGETAQDVVIRSPWVHVSAIVCLAAAALLLRRASA